MSAQTAEERFWAKVEFTGFCWLWTAARDRYGYGLFRVPDKGIRLAHRLAYGLLVEPPPPNLRHLCRTRHCINPDHLVELVIAAPRPRRPPRPKLSFEERFWARVERTGGCWIWNGYIDKYGYGTCKNSVERTSFAHRVAYELTVGPIPSGMQIDHLCRVRRCVNPDHLEPVTHQENATRGVSSIAQRWAWTHCPRGHAYPPKVPGVRRRCQQCRQERQLAAAP